jgi:hypothetical protein
MHCLFIYLFFLKKKGLFALLYKEKKIKGLGQRGPSALSNQGLCI